MIGARALRSGLRQAWIGRTITLAGLLTVAVILSSRRLVMAPGFEFYLGPLFYLLAYRAIGLRPALIVAVAVMLPSLLWWGHPMALALGLAQLLFIDRFGRGVSLAKSVLLFHCLIGWAAILLYLHLYAHVGLVAGGGLFLRKVLLDLSLALIVDLFSVFFMMDGRLLWPARRRTISLSGLIETSTMLLLTATAVLLFANDVHAFSGSFADFRDDLRRSVQIEARDVDLPVGSMVLRSIDVPPLGPQKVLIGHGMMPPLARFTGVLGCTRLTSAPDAAADQDRNSLSYWFSACSVGTVTRDGRTIWFASATRPLAEQAYQSLLDKMLELLAVMAIALAVHFAINRALQRALASWAQVVSGFGTPHLATPKSVIFSEFERPISTYVAANNRYTALIEERATLADSVTELKSAIDLRLLRDIRYDAANQRLLFTDVDLESGARPGSVKVHPNDAVAFANAADSSDPLIEFRLAEGQTGEWFMLLAHEPAGPLQWRSGCFFRLRRVRMADPGILHQARLIELGGMASALSHELRQPLFTISLAAENGALLCGQAEPDADKIKPKFERVLEQVERASSIIKRISRYARVDSDDMPPVPLIDAVNAAAKFMRPLLVEKNVQIRIKPSWGVRTITAPRVALEQILVNAIQNSVDAIVSYREAHPTMLDGVIEIALHLREGVASITITDNGTGLDPAIEGDVFDAFLTTKPTGKGTGLGLYVCRQIMSELSGSVEICSRRTPNHGAALTLRFPAQSAFSDNTANEVFV
jgi:signal transduction histidine kinase